MLNYSNKLSHGTFGGPGFSVITGLKGELASLSGSSLLALLDSPIPDNR